MLLKFHIIIILPLEVIIAFSDFLSSKLNLAGVNLWLPMLYLKTSSGFSTSFFGFLFFLPNFLTNPDSSPALAGIAIRNLSVVAKIQDPSCVTSTLVMDSPRPGKLLFEFWPISLNNLISPDRLPTARFPLLVEVKQENLVFFE